MKGKILSTAVAVFRDERVKHHVCLLQAFIQSRTSRAHGHGRDDGAIVVIMTEALWAHLAGLIRCSRVVIIMNNNILMRPW